MADHSPSSLPLVIDSRKRHGDPAHDNDDGSPPTEPATSSLFAERKRGRPKKESNSASAGMQKMTRAEAQQLEAQRSRECEVYFGACERLVGTMRAWRGGEEGEGEGEVEAWAVNAERLLEMFRETRALFPAASVSLGSFKSLSWALGVDFYCVVQELSGCPADKEEERGGEGE